LWSGELADLCGCFVVGMEAAAIGTGIAVAVWEGVKD
jgi:hypothetical protein